MPHLIKTYDPGVSQLNHINTGEQFKKNPQTRPYAEARGLGTPKLLHNRRKWARENPGHVKSVKICHLDRVFKYEHILLWNRLVD